MAHTADIFLRVHDLDMDRFALKVARIVGRDAIKKSDPADTWFDLPAVHGEPCLIQIGTAEDFENDRDLLFESYTLNIGFVNGTEEQNIAEARKLFELLKSAMGYPMMLVDDMQRKLDQYDP